MLVCDSFYFVELGCLFVNDEGCSFVLLGIWPGMRKIGD